MTLVSLPYRALSEQSKFFSKLFADYAGVEPTRAHTLFGSDYRNPQHISEKLAKRAAATANREGLVEVLLRQNRALGAGEKTLANIEKLRKPTAMTVVTGQQLGIFTGAMYTIIKTLSAVHRAAQYHQQFSDYDFVPVFWLEGEDHDYDEIASVTIPAADGKPKPFRYTEKNAVPRGMTGRTMLSSDIQFFVNDFLSSLPSSEFKPTIADLLRQSYKEGETFLTAFAKTMNALFADYGLVFISPDDAAYKRLAAEVFMKELQEQPQSSTAVIQQSAMVEEAGYEIQAKARAVNLYLIRDNKRFSIEPASKEWELLPLRETITSASLLETAYSAPEQFSPNVILRPVIQDAVLPTAAYIAGPGEIGYWAQLKKVYAFFKVEMPLVVPRTSLTIVEPRFQKTFEKLSHAATLDRARLYQEYLINRQTLIDQAIASESSLDAEKLFADAEGEVKELLARLDTILKPVDFSLSQALEGAGGKMLFQLQSMKEKTLRAQKQKEGSLAEQTAKLEPALLPDGKLQERVINVFYFLSKYGMGFMETLYNAVEQSSTDVHTMLEL
jgi:bacillithiol synthase